ncbi:YkgJ family cysteine cluster protein [Fundidesulfovibrio agrisoli]|uniref:YkgJ family cysteine cluster protein n=1 Tax=Fundidesulfovibrio agrisoli TaxID=2922717 RepID=UPI001FAE3BA5|nr:YkgJ family cysteine cluster protein [Fundidesulfovibrio agrisoli]
MDIRISDAASGKNLHIDFASGISVSCAFFPPEGEVALVDILPEIFSLSNELIAHALAAAAAEGSRASCEKGCVSCCYQLIVMSDHEALLLAHIVSLMEPKERARVKAALRSMLQILERHGLLAEMLDSHANCFTDSKRLVEVQKKYWELQLACPFLVDGACSVYAFRPLVCRQYMVSSPRECCAQIFKPGNMMKKIPLAYDLGSALASFNGAAAKPTLAVPIPAVLLVNGLLESFPRPKASAEAMMAAFLAHLEENFTRSAARP